jgi:hypothetical protein
MRDVGERLMVNLFDRVHTAKYWGIEDASGFIDDVSSNNLIWNPSRSGLQLYEFY